MAANEYDVVVSALAEGREVGFCMPGTVRAEGERVCLARQGDALVATRVDGSLLGVFASLDAALDAIEGDMLAPGSTASPMC